jgi:hypothetical protein
MFPHFMSECPKLLEALFFEPTLPICHYSSQDGDLQILLIPNAYWDTLALPGANQFLSGQQLPIVVTHIIREGKPPDDKKTLHFVLNFFASFHFFHILFPSSLRNSTKPQHFTMCQYSAKHYSGIMCYISPQPHVMQQFGLW